MKRDEFNRYLLKTLNPSGNPVMDRYANGLQIEGSDEINKVVFGVDAVMEFFQKAHNASADAVIVHHGLLLSDIPKSIPDVLTQQRMKFLYQKNISLFAFHFLLDSHPELGHNSQVLQRLGIKPEKPFANFDGIHWGWEGNFSKPVKRIEAFEKLNAIFHKNAKMYDYGKAAISSVAVVTGRGTAAIDEVIEKNIDLFITGEVKGEHQEFCRESKLNLVWGGHYITETLGMKALMNKVEHETGLETEFI